MITFLSLITQDALLEELKVSLALYDSSLWRLFSFRDAPNLAVGYNTLALNAGDDDILVFIHQDTRLLFDWPNLIPRYFQNLPNAGVVGFIGLNHVRAKSWGAWSHGGVLEGREKRRIKFNACDKHDDLFWKRVDVLDCACLMIRNSVFKKIGGFDERHKGWNMHDIDFCMNALQAGYFNYCIGECIQHYGGSLIRKKMKPGEYETWLEKWKPWLTEQGRMK